MNSYYTNQIEGQHTRPADIDRALSKDFDKDLDIAKKQRIAISHLASEVAMETKLEQADLYKVEFIKAIHFELFNRLSTSDRKTDEGIEVVPGEFRDIQVEVGRHLPPEAASSLMAKYSDAYASYTQANEISLIATAAAHHRLTWIHPFLDGNGRTARLHSHLTLRKLGLSNGLWSIMRGLARHKSDYFQFLNNADLPRTNDLDGRGPLSERDLTSFINFFLNTCLDQIIFMEDILNMDHLKKRIADLMRYLQENPFPIGKDKSLVTTDSIEAVQFLAFVGSLPRQKFKNMINQSDRNGRRIISSLIEFGLLTSPSHRGPLSFSIPNESLRFLFPNLWREAE